MNMHFKSWLAGTTMLMMTVTGAFAEVVYNRGSAADTRIARSAQDVDHL